MITGFTCRVRRHLRRAAPGRHEAHVVGTDDDRIAHVVVQGRGNSEVAFARAEAGVDLVAVELAGHADATADTHL